MKASRLKENDKLLNKHKVTEERRKQAYEGIISLIC